MSRKGNDRRSAMSHQRQIDEFGYRVIESQLTGKKLEETNGFNEKSSDRSQSGMENHVTVVNGDIRTRKNSIAVPASPKDEKEAIDPAMLQAIKDIEEKDKLSDGVFRAIHSKSLFSHEWK